MCRDAFENGIENDLKKVQNIFKNEKRPKDGFAVQNRKTIKSKENKTDYGKISFKNNDVEELEEPYIEKNPLISEYSLRK